MDNEELGANITVAAIRNALNNLTAPSVYYSSSDVLVENIDENKPKRKYTKKKVVKEVITDEEYNNKRKDLLKKLQKSIYSYRATNKIFKRELEDYICFILERLCPKKEVKVFIEEYHKKCNYISYRICINCKRNNAWDYDDYTVKIDIEELHNNCSSVGIHHFNGSIYNYYNYSNSNSYLFSDEKDVKLFLDEMVEICKIAGYSNILYTISNESNKSLEEYAKEKGKEILSFTNKRTKNVVKYYSQLI